MTDEQRLRLAFVVLFNAPVVLVALLYFAMTLVTYRHYADQRALRMVVLAMCAVAGTLALTAASVALNFGSAAEIANVSRFLVGLSRLVLLVGLGSVCWIWWRNER